MPRGAPPREAKTGTHGVVARDAPRVVVLRRGPTRHVRLLAWDLRDDTIEAGQWLVGGVDPGPCGLSPNGQLFVYEGRKAGRNFTAVSRPPFFTALAFWPSHQPWTGGGFFVDDRHLVLGVVDLAPASGALVPPALRLTNVWTYFGSRASKGESVSDAARRAPEARQGWLPGEGHDVSRKPNPRAAGVDLVRTRASSRSRGRFVLVADGSEHDLGDLDWADWAHDGSLVSGDAGLLLRRGLEETLRGQPPRVVADLRAQRFEPSPPPPEALAWPAYLRRARRR